MLLLLEGCCLMALYNFQGLRFLFCCMVFIPFVCFLLLIPMIFSCTVSLKSCQEEAVRMEPVRLRLTVENRGMLPISGLFVCVRWKAPGEKEVKVRRRLCGLGRNDRGEIMLELSALHCGRARLRVTRVRLFDYLGLFSLPVRIREQTAEIYIYPVVTPIMKEAVALDSWEMGKEREGDTFLREYLPGDSLRRIYWQLSAKTGDMLIRDLEQSGAIRIFLDFPSGYRGRFGEWDNYLDRACSLLYFLAEENGGALFSTEVVWRHNGNLFIYDISDAAALQIWVGALLAEEPLGEPLAPEENVLGEAFCLKEDCRLYFGEQCIYG